MKKKLKHFVLHISQEDCMGRLEEVLTMSLFKLRADSIKFRDCEMDISDLEVNEFTEFEFDFGGDSLDQWEHGSYYITCLRIK